MPGAVLEVRNLSIDLIRGGESRPVLRDVNFAVGEREILGIIGESGSGKSVLARALTGSISAPLHHTSGSVSYRGADLLKLTPVDIQKVRGRKIGYIGPDPGNAFDPTLPIGGQLVEKLHAVRPGCSRREAFDRVVALLESVHIPAAAARFHEFPFQYSGGMLQRAMIADALVAEPDVVIADNITQPLDVTIAAQIVRLLRELRDSIKSAIVYVANSLPAASEIADEVAVLSGGRLVERGTGKCLARRPHDEYTRRLVASIPRIWEVRDVCRPSLSGEQPILSVKEVFKTYYVRDRSRPFYQQSIRAVRGVTFDVRAGENFGLIGESGCGKSTLSRLLTWIEAPDSGKILFDQVEIAKMSHRERLAMRKRFQLLLQDPYTSIPPNYSIGRTIEEPVRIHDRMSAKARRERVREAMREVGLSPADYQRLPVGLSAGQRQRVNLARALILEPRLLILDETLSSLDQSEQGRLLELFEKLQVKYGLTYLFISHDLSLVRRVCNRVAVMYLGKIVELGNNESLFFQPAHPYTRALLSAVPTLETKPFRTSECLLDGEPPSPINLTPGCGFAARCPIAAECCSKSEPVLQILPGGTATACFIAQARGALPRLGSAAGND
jgi:peptide/nickel transport system ATP-binding protein